jgi:hypothetical protein
MLYDIKRGSQVIATVYPEGQQEKEIMVKDIVPISFSYPSSIRFAIGDTIEVWGETYYLNQMDETTKDSSLKFSYQMLFQAAYYSLAKPKMFFYDRNNELKVLKFEIIVNASLLLDLIVANANRTQSGWTKGDCDETEYKLLPFNGESVLTALDNGAKEFRTEWWVVNKVIHLTKRGVSSGLRVAYGYDKGLRGGLTRTNVDSTSVFSRLYVSGSDKNLPANYRNGQKNLMLPEPMDFIQGPIYGDEEIEAVINFPDIKPGRIGTITSVTSPFMFTDTGIDFNVNDHLMTISAKVSFVTGQLSGYTFEIPKGGYNTSTKTVTIIKNEVEKDLNLPSDLLKPAVGDTYFFEDVISPPADIIAAQLKLLEKGTEYFNAQSVPRVAYSVPPDFFYFKRNQKTLSLGDYIYVEDFDLQLDKDIRINSYERDLHEKYKYNALTISDLALGSPIVRQVAAAQKVTKNLALNRISDINRARMGWKSSREMMNQYFDPSTDQIFTDAISPITLRALMIQTGDASQQLVLDGINFKSNYEGDVNKLAWSEGQLIHATIEANARSWDIPGATIEGLEPGTAYYVYAKCNRTTVDGVILVTSVQVKVDEDPDFYHFWIGFANSVIDNFRLLKSVYGSVSIYGRTIEGGIIFGQNLEINLDEGSVKGMIVMNDGSYTVGTVVVGDPNDLEGLGNAFISGITDEGPLSVRFGAGGQRGDADLPFKVLDDGSLVATKGSIGGWEIGLNNLQSGNINADYIEMHGGDDPYLYMKNDDQIAGDADYSKISPKSIFVSSAGTQTPTAYNDIMAVAAYKLNNHVTGPITRAAMYLKSPANGLALYSEGPVLMSGPNLTLNFDNIFVHGGTGVNIELDVRTGGEQFYHMVWRNGILVRATKNN